MVQGERRLLTGFSRLFTKWFQSLIFYNNNFAKLITSIMSMFNLPNTILNGLLGKFHDLQESYQKSPDMSSIPN